MQRPGFVLTLGALSAVTATAIDICIPAQPQIARELGQDPAAGAQLVSFFLLGYGAGQLFWGPFSDRYGRLPLLYLSLAGFLIASLVCATTESMAVLVWARLVQGLLGGGAPVIARAIARDQGGGPETAALISTMTIVLGAAPLVAPSLGSGLLTLVDWRGIFWFLGLFALVLLVLAVVFLRGQSPLQERPALAPYLLGALLIFRARDFLLGTAISSSVFLGYAAFLSVGALVAQDRYGVSPAAFGPIFAIAALAFILGSVAARQAIRRVALDKVILIGASLGSLAGVGLILNADAELDLVSFWALLSGYVLGFGMLLPVAVTKALEPAGSAAGAASSLMGVIQVLCGAFGAELAASALFASTYQALCIIMPVAMAAALALALLSLGLRKRA